jgi:hypothetical protein
MQKVEELKKKETLEWQQFINAVREEIYKSVTL